MKETLKLVDKTPWKGARPWIPGMLKKGGKHQVKTKKRVRVNDKVNFRKEQ